MFGKIKNLFTKKVDDDSVTQKLIDFTGQESTILGASMASKDILLSINNLSAIGKAGLDIFKGIGSKELVTGLAKNSKGVGLLAKATPFIGPGLGILFAALALYNRDYVGAALELSSGAASMIPGLGIGLSAAIDLGIRARSWKQAKDVKLNIQDKIDTVEQQDQLEFINNYNGSMMQPVPALASGGPLVPGQLTLVGEEGPELVKLGTDSMTSFRSAAVGAGVISTPDTVSILSNAVSDGMQTAISAKDSLFAKLPFFSKTKDEKKKGGMFAKAEEEDLRLEEVQRDIEKKIILEEIRDGILGLDGIKSDVTKEDKKGIFDFFKGGITKLLGGLGLGSLFSSIFTKPLGWIKGLIGNAATSLTSTINSAASSTASTLRDLVKTGGSMLSNAAKSLGSSALDLVKKIPGVESAIDIGKSAVSKGKELVTRGKDLVTSTVSRVSDGAKSMIDKGKSVISKGATSLFDKAKGFGGKLFDSIKSLASKTVTAVTPTNIMKMAKGALSKVASVAKGALKGSWITAAIMSVPEAYNILTDNEMSDDDKRKGLIKIAASTGGGIAVGALLGTVIGAPTGPGAIISGIVGGYVGAKAGEKVADAINAYFDGDAENGNNKTNMKEGNDPTSIPVPPKQSFPSVVPISTPVQPQLAVPPTTRPSKSTLVSKFQSKSSMVLPNVEGLADQAKQALSKLNDTSSDVQSTGLIGTSTEKKAKSLIMKHEGVRLDEYKDSLGLPTIGVGHLNTGENFVGKSLTMPQVTELFNIDFEKHADIAEKIPNFSSLTDEGKIAMYDVTFNIPAVTDPKKWPNFNDAMKDKDFTRAASELLDSNYAKQVGQRAQTVAGLLASSASDVISMGKNIISDDIKNSISSGISIAKDTISQNTPGIIDKSKSMVSSATSSISNFFSNISLPSFAKGGTVSINQPFIVRDELVVPQPEFGTIGVIPLSDIKPEDASFDVDLVNTVRQASQTTLEDNVIRSEKQQNIREEEELKGKGREKSVQPAHTTNVNQIIKGPTTTSNMISGGGSSKHGTNNTIETDYVIQGMVEKMFAMSNGQIFAIAGHMGGIEPHMFKI